ncbi:MAG: GntR family transcriptional regulator [Pseudomonadota bacterium]
MLVTSSRGGFMLRRILEREAGEIYDVRAAIEGQAVHLLALCNDPAVHNHLRQVIAKEEKVTSETVQAYFSANRSIHRSIVEATGNTLLVDMFDNIWNRAGSFHLFAAIEEIDLAQSLGNHLELVEAMATGDVQIATSAIFDHISEGLALQARALKLRQGD